MLLKNLLAVLLLFYISNSCFAQTDLPYSTDWANTSSQNEWTQYRVTPSNLFDWDFNNSGELTHDYPVGNTQGDTIRDWMVSPAINFFSTSKLSFRAKTFTFIGSADVDYFGIWFSAGSKDPNDGDYVELVDLTNFSSDNIWKDTTNVEIPYTAPTGYIAIVYEEDNNWFTVGIADIVITPDNPMSSNSNLEEERDIHFFPSPIIDFATLHIEERQNIKDSKLLIYNDLGQVVLEKTIIDYQTRLDFTDLSKGKYFYQVIRNDKILKVGKVLLQ